MEMMATITIIHCPADADKCHTRFRKIKYQVKKSLENKVNPFVDKPIFFKKKENLYEFFR